MKQIDKTVVNYLLLVYGAFILLGFFFIVVPRWGLTAVTWLIGLGFLIFGMICFGIFLWNRKREINGIMLLWGVLGIIAGIVVMVFRLKVALVILPSLIGIAVVASAAWCVLTAMHYHSCKIPRWWMPLIAALVSLIVAVLIFLNLSSTATLLTRIIGIYCIAFSALRFGESCMIKKYL